MTLWRMVPLRPGIPPGLNGTGEKEETTAEGIVGRDVMARTDVARSKTYQFLETPPRIMPSLTTTGAARLIITSGRDTPIS